MSRLPGNGRPLGDVRARFRFVIVADRTGGHRPGVFEQAMAKIDLLRPDFVVCIGDLIEGYTDDRDEIDAQWTEVDGLLGRLDVPVFYVPGNHDLSNPTMAAHWAERHGATYYHFVHDNVLFLVLNTEDPPVRLPDDILARQAALEEAMAADPEATQQRILELSRTRDTPVRPPGQVAISDEQVDYVARTLAETPGVSWTMVLLHKPAWMYDSDSFVRVEELLQGRRYSAVAGHVHYYAYDTRFGQDHLDLATTGGVWLREGPGSIDHVLWVTMTGDGPVFANLALDGIFDKHGPDRV